MNAVVKLKYGDEERPMWLVNNKLHIPSVKDMFGLSRVGVGGAYLPTDGSGLSFATYQSGDTLQISGAAG